MIRTRIRIALAALTVVLATGLMADSALAGSGGLKAPEDGPTGKAKLTSSGKAIAPDDAPRRVKRAIRAGNEIRNKPYKWGGGHGSFEDRGYDCSGAVSYVLRGARAIKAPMDSTGLMSWGRKGKGRWITVYAHGGHTYVMVAGLRFDTAGGDGPRWHKDKRSKQGFAVRTKPKL